jgi:hypothetical protein
MSNEIVNNPADSVRGPQTDVFHADTASIACPGQESTEDNPRGSQVEMVAGLGRAEK